MSTEKAKSVQTEIQFGKGFKADRQQVTEERGNLQFNNNNSVRRYVKGFGNKINANGFNQINLTSNM